jgi:hypothetical protein
VRRPFSKRERREDREPAIPPPLDTEAETVADHPNAPRSVPPPAGSRSAAQPPVPAAAPPPVPLPLRRKHELPAAPTMGRIASNWRRRLADTTWPRPGVAADGGELGGFQVLAASVAGQKHLHEGSQRQDAYYFASLGDDGVVLAVADGVSSRPLAAIGAEVAVFAAVRGYLKATWSTAGEEDGGDELSERLAAAVDRGEDAVFEAANQMRIETGELSTTLLIADLRRGDDGSVAVTTAGVGNSSALALAPGSPPAVIGGPPEGGSPAQYHHFLPGDPGRAQVDRARLPAGAALVLATDGFADDLHASPAVRDWLWDRIGAAASPIEFAHVLSYRRQGTNDDLTAVVARPLAR